MFIPFRHSPKKIECEHCNYKIVEPFPPNSYCPSCGKFSANIFNVLNDSDTNQQEIKPKRREVRTPSSEVDGVDVRSDVEGELTDEFIQFAGITSQDDPQNQIFWSNPEFKFLLDLTFNLNFIATSILGGTLDMMLLISDNNEESKCLFLSKNNFIYVINGMFTNKKGKYILNGFRYIYEDFLRNRDINSLSADEISLITLKLKAHLNTVKEVLRTERIFTNKEISYIDTWLQVDYMGLSSKSIGIISLLLDDKKKVNIDVRVRDEQQDIDEGFHEDSLTAKIQAISAVTEGMSKSYPRWIAVEVKFQKYRYLSFKKYPNNYFSYFLSEGNLELIPQVEDQFEPFLRDVISQPFTNDLRPFKPVRAALKEFFSTIPHRKFSRKINNPADASNV